MARKDLGLLTRRIDEMKPTPAAAEPAPALVTSTPEAGPTVVAEAPASVPAANAAAPRKPAAKKQTSTPAPRFGAVTEYERKETWLRPDQQVALDQIAKRLQRAKDPGEKTRITANTIIRVAVDALLEHADQLQGNTETQIRESAILSIPAN